MLTWYFIKMNLGLSIIFVYINFFGHGALDLQLCWYFLFSFDTVIVLVIVSIVSQC
jgi:hypothetical protein